MAYLYRKRGYWYVGYRTPNGWKRESLKTRQKGEARQALSRFIRREEAGEVVPDASVSLTDFVAYYIEYRRQALGASSFGSQEKYRIPLFIRFLTASGVQRLDAVQRVHVEAYIRQRQATVSPATASDNSRGQAGPVWWGGGTCIGSRACPGSNERSGKIVL